MLLSTRLHQWDIDALVHTSGFFLKNQTLHVLVLELVLGIILVKAE